MIVVFWTLGIGLVLTLMLFWVLIRRRNMQRWIGSYIVQTPRRRDPLPSDEVHVILCVTDHYEPKGFADSREQSRARVEKWVRGYPAQFGRFLDSDGRTPKHSFFYPIEEYEPEYLDALAELCQAGFGEVEIHLHHDNDNAENLRANLQEFKTLLADRHGLLGRHRETGEIRYGFIHGNWTLNNSHPLGHLCGVEGELEVLRSTGCYADFTLPSAPNPAQTPTINSIYYAKTDARNPKAHERGLHVGQGEPSEPSLMIVQGPLLLDWSRRKWGLVPRLENACLQGSQPPSMERLQLWLRARVQVPQRPDWFFVKLHAHGAVEESHPPLLGEPMVAFHEALTRRAITDSKFHIHYVTAREMYNLIRAAEADWKGSVADALNFEILPPAYHPVEQGSSDSVHR